MKTIIITGGTGLVGTRLTEFLLEREYEIILFSRNCNLHLNPIFQKLQSRYPGKLSCAAWDLEKQEYDVHSIERADAIINLAGANIAEKRWTEDRKRIIQNSRIHAGNLICKALSESKNHKVKTVISASGIGWYGDDKDRPLDTPFKEDTSPANDFMGITSRLWEESIHPVQSSDVRLVILRTGIVLSSQGGMIPELIKSLNLRIASIFGNGHQVVSWIHIDDLCDLYTAALEMEDMEGVYNAVVPFSVTNARLVNTLAEKLHKKKYAQMRVPKSILKLALGELSQELLKSCLVSSKKVLDTGFSFQYPRIKDAIDDLVR